MEEIESVSCVKFRQRKNDRFFLKIYRVPGGPGSLRGAGTCFSHIGRRTDEKYTNVGQLLRLDDNCYDQGTIIHELMHALGFEHEQARKDRDQFVEIVYDNILPNNEHNFDKTADPDMIHLGTAYDYHSIMHYKWNAFAKDKSQHTIKIKDTRIDSKILGTRERLSPTDIFEIKALYNCDVTQRPYSSVQPPVRGAISGMAVANVQYRTVKYKDCKSAFEIIDVQANLCPGDHDYCPFLRGTRPRIRITFKPNREVKTLEASVRARLAGVSVPFNLEEPDACQNSNITCPLQAGEIYYYSQTVHILENYPKVSVQVQWSLNDPSNDETEEEHKREVCVIFMAKVVSSWPYKK